MYLIMRDAKTWNPLSIEQWVAWLGATSIAAVSMTVFFYSNFETKSETQAYHDSEIRFHEQLEKRLDRIENKLDLILTNYK
jgi:hypothetical protein